MLFQILNYTTKNIYESTKVSKKKNNIQNEMCQGLEILLFGKKYAFPIYLRRRVVLIDHLKIYTFVGVFRTVKCIQVYKTSQ